MEDYDELPELDSLDTSADVAEVSNGAALLDQMNGLHVDHYFTAEEGGIANVLGKKIVVTAIADRNSGFQRPDGQKGEFLAVAAKVIATKGKNKGQEKSVGFNTGSTVLIKQLRQLRPHFPVEVVLEKVDKKNGWRYYQVKA